MIRTILALVAFACLISPVSARTYVVDPGCNIIFPCEGVSVSVRGNKVVKAMHGFGSPQKVYTPRVIRKRRVIVRGVLTESSVSRPGIVRSVSGATAHVASSATAAFQCLVSALDAQGYPVRFMGGWRAHGSVRGSLHPSGLALDVNQVARNVTTPRMPGNEVALANGCGLVSGAQWAHGDSGHFQFGGYTGTHRHYASHHRKHYASQ